MLRGIEIVGRVGQNGEKIKEDQWIGKAAT
jgi:hypothetical protein